MRLSGCHLYRSHNVACYGYWYRTSSFNCRENLHIAIVTLSLGLWGIENIRKTGSISWSIFPYAKESPTGWSTTKHLCIDYHGFNCLLPLVVKVHLKAQAILSLVPLLKINELYTMLNGSTFHSSLDCTLGCHHIALSPEAQKNSTFVKPYGKFEFKKVLFGLTQAPIHFHQWMKEVLKGLPFSFGYLDDIQIFMQNNEKHLKHLRAILIDWVADLKLKTVKCESYPLSEKGIFPYLRSYRSSKIFQDQKYPRNLGTLGLTGFYHKFIPAYDDLVWALMQLTRKTTPIIWTLHCQKACKTLEDSLMKSPILGFPNKSYTLFMDVS